MEKEGVIRSLREMASLLRAHGESEYRARAYETAAQRIGQVQGDLDELAKKGRLTDLPGIGDALAARITELLTTGRSDFLERLRKEFPPGMAELMRVPSLGTKKAVALWKALGVEDLASLERALQEGRVATVSGFGPRTQAKLLEAVEELKRQPPPEDLRKLSDVLTPLEQLLHALHQHDLIVRGSVAGGARRAAEELADPRAVVSSHAPGKVFDALDRLPDVAKVTRRDEHQARIHLFDRDLAFDLTSVRDAAFPTALFFATGSETHVARVCAVAERKGLSLTATALLRRDRPVDLSHEEDLYGALDLPFIPPELREDGSELDAPVPEDLLQLEDLKGVVHSHSTWSDGNATLEEMARAAKARGFRYLTVTEHSPTASYAGGLTVDDLKRQWDEIDALNEELAPFRLLKGIESDILKNGALDFPDAILRRLDVVIGSVHNRYGLNEREMTDRILRAMDNPHLHILGHLTGRLIQRRAPYAVRLDEIFDKAKAKGVAIEINGSPHRLDIHAGFAREALRRGIPLVASADSHSTRELDNLRYAVVTARRGWVTRRDVLNTLDADAFVHKLHALRR